MTPLEPILDLLEVEFDPAKGGNQQVMCPFHLDTHPSASVHLDKGLFTCFGCDAKGDAISLLMLKEGLDFVRAKYRAEELAGRAGSPVQRESDSGSGLLPRKSGHRPGRRNWESPWKGLR